MRASGPEHLEDFPLICRWCVRSPEANGHRAGAEPVFDASAHLRDLGVGGGAAGGRTARKEVTRVTHHRHPHGDVSNRDAVVNQLAGLALAIPPLDVSGADLELQYGRHALQRSVPIVLCVLPVTVQVDEARRDDQPARVDPLLALERLRVDRRNAPITNADVSYCVETGLRIEHAAVVDDE